MRKYFLFFFVSLVCFLSCKKDVQIDNTTTTLKKSDKNTTISHKASSKVNITSLTKIASWKEYTAFINFCFGR